MEDGWSIKAMHREIMLSATYQLSTDVDEKNLAQDPANHLLWRANLQQRLDAEALRDSLLAVSGELDPSMGGPPVPLGETNLPADGVCVGRQDEAGCGACAFRFSESECYERAAAGDGGSDAAAVFHE